MSAVIELLLSIPPVRFVMGLVGPRWRPLWAALWLAVIAYILSRTMNQLALRRARLRLLEESPIPERPNQSDSSTTVEARAEPVAPGAVASPQDQPPRAASSGQGSGWQQRVRAVPLQFVAIAVTVGAVAVALASAAMRSNTAEPAALSAPALDTSSAAERGLDFRWRSGRMVDDDCVGTFELVSGPTTSARVVAFVMDTSGAIMARDSARVESTVRGLLVEFRFRHVDCDEISDWQLQVTTPRARSN